MPSGYCLRCLGCCRFSANPTIWATPACRLVESSAGYRCEHLNENDSRCAIYSKRPLDCRLYPFLLVKRNGSLSLGLHKSCFFVEEKRPNIREYAGYLKKALSRPEAISELGKNPEICADYRENVEIVVDLGEVYKKIRDNKALPKLNRLTLKDKPIVDKYLKKIQTGLSTYHFAPLFIWKDLFKIYWVVIENNLCLFYQDNIGIFMPLAPLGDGNERALKQCFEIMDFYNLNKEVSRIENVAVEDAGRTKLKDSEYLCLCEALAQLKGDAYRHKRASCNHFVRNYPYQVLAYRQSMRKDCLELYHLWRNQRKQSHKPAGSGLASDKPEGNACLPARQGAASDSRSHSQSHNDQLYRQMLEDSGVSFNAALRYSKRIGLSGYVVKASGKIKACSLGYPLNKEIFCILFEVCDLGLRGIAQFIFREFCRRLSGYKYINIMGCSDLENLKALKLSYRPLKQINAYNIY